MNKVDQVLGAEKTHPSFGMLAVDKVSSNVAKPLFGSSIKHRDTIRLTLKRGKVCRKLNQDWFFGGERLFEVEMSYAQFAQIMTSMNVGDGIPVTLCHVNGEGEIPPCPFEDKASAHLSEFREHLAQTYEKSEQLLARVRQLFASKKSLNKAEQHEILSALSAISYDIGSNQDFQVTQFQEQMEKTIREGKGEIESFFQSRMNDVAARSLGEDQLKNLLSSAPVVLEDD